MRNKQQRKKHPSQKTTTKNKESKAKKAKVTVRRDTELKY